MSYDLHVYAPDAVDGVRLRDVVSAVPSLDIGECDESHGWCTVVRGPRRSYCFTIDGPVRVEPEDVPDEVTAVLLGATHLVHLTVEGSSTADIPYAVRFARRLAQSLGGVVADQQRDEVWARGAARRAEQPTRGQRVKVIDVNWYLPSARVPDDLGAQYVTLCRRTLPEALPRRFGEHEPLQEELAEAGDDGFASAWRQATGSVFFTASPPCIAGSMGAAPGHQRLPPVWRLGLQVHWQPFADDERWRGALRRLFVAIAGEFSAGYASAEVTRGGLWSGRSLWADGATEWATVPARVDGWKGLPPYPTWWAWYGDPYRSLVRGRMPVGGVTEHATGILHELAGTPADRDELVRAITRRRGLRRSAQWVPPDLLARVRPGDEGVRPVPLGPARTVPHELL